MLHARRDYDCIQPWPTKRPHYGRLNGGPIGAIPGDAEQLAEPAIPDDEPVLLLRAQDVCAPATLRFYAEQLMDSSADKELVDAILRHADRMEDWQEARRAKVPDADKAVLW